LPAHRLLPHANSWSNCYTHTCGYADAYAYLHAATVLSTSSFTYYNPCNDAYTHPNSGTNCDSDTHTGTYGNTNSYTHARADAHARAYPYAHPYAYAYTNTYAHSTSLYPDCNIRRLLLDTCAGSSRRQPGGPGRMVKCVHRNTGRNCGDTDISGFVRVPVLWLVGLVRADT
jgi:hypothetical protein